MTRYLLFLAMAALAGCSGGAPTVDAPATPSTILLPAEPAPSEALGIMFIGELAGTAVNDGNTWVAVANVTVLDGAGEPVPDVRVSGEWDPGDTGEVFCTTDEAGTCDLESDSLRKRVPLAVLRITAIEHRRLTYHPNLDEADASPEQPRELIVRKP
jgi:hypothetical protein